MFNRRLALAMAVAVMVTAVPASLVPAVAAPPASSDHDARWNGHWVLNKGMSTFSPASNGWSAATLDTSFAGGDYTSTANITDCANSPYTVSVTYKLNGVDRAAAHSKDEMKGMKVRARLNGETLSVTFTKGATTLGTSTAVLSADGNRITANMTLPTPHKTCPLTSYKVVWDKN
jgi:hypothetical protein